MSQRWREGGREREGLLLCDDTGPTPSPRVNGLFRSSRLEVPFLVRGAAVCNGRNTAESRDGEISFVPFLRVNHGNTHTYTHYSREKETDAARTSISLSLSLSLSLSPSAHTRFVIRSLIRGRLAKSRENTYDPPCILTLTLTYTYVEAI